MHLSPTFLYTIFLFLAPRRGRAWLDTGAIKYDNYFSSSAIKLGSSSSPSFTFCPTEEHHQSSAMISQTQRLIDHNHHDTYSSKNQNSKESQFISCATAISMVGNDASDFIEGNDEGFEELKIKFSATGSLRQI